MSYAPWPGTGRPELTPARGAAALARCPGYIGEFEVVDDRRSGKIVVSLNGRINKCGVISPRFDMSAHESEKWVATLLPSRQVRRRCWPGFAPAVQGGHARARCAIICADDALAVIAQARAAAHTPRPAPRPATAPPSQFGHIVLTTSQGIMDHEEARRKHTGGKVLGFFF